MSLLGSERGFRLALEGASLLWHVAVKGRNFVSQRVLRSISRVHGEIPQTELGHVADERLLPGRGFGVLPPLAALRTDIRIGWENLRLGHSRALFRGPPLVFACHLAVLFSRLDSLSYLNGKFLIQFIYIFFKILT